MRGAGTLWALPWALAWMPHDGVRASARPLAVCEKIGEADHEDMRVA